MSLGRPVPAPLELDFSGRRPWPGLLGWILLALGLAAAGLELRQWRAGEADLAEREAIVERLRHQVRRAEATASNTRAEAASNTRAEAPSSARGARAVSEQEARPALRLAGQLGADWGAVLHELAAAEDDRLGLLSLEMDAPRGSLRLAGEAKTLAAVFDYLGRLEASPSLAAAQLTGYERTTVGAVELIHFTATVAWTGRP
jgi:sugar phosphate isomerase/epimerase